MSTNIDSESYYSVPNIVHFLPGCDDHISQWKEHNDDFVLISWNHATLERLYQAIPSFSESSSDRNYDPIVASCCISFLFGGIVVSNPEKCYLPLRSVLVRYPNALLATFSHYSIILSVPKIVVFQELFKHFVVARSPETNKKIFSQFLNNCQPNSKAESIVVLDDTIYASLTKPASVLSTLFEHILRPNLHGNNRFFVHDNNSNLEFVTEIRNWLSNTNLTELSAQDENTEEVGLLVLARDRFDHEKPVDDALDVLLTFQKFRLSKPCLLVINNAISPAEIGIDFLLFPQLKFLNATELVREHDVVIWRIS